MRIDHKLRNFPYLLVQMDFYASLKINSQILFRCRLSK
jgi:hypothetical protein